MTVEHLRILLTIFLVAIYLLAMFYLRRRRLSASAYIFWGLMALAVPALGPFLVILARPGESRTRPKLHNRTVR